MTSNKVQVIIKDGKVNIYNESGKRITLEDFYEYVEKKNNIKFVKSEFSHSREYFPYGICYDPYIYLEKGNYNIFVHGWEEISKCKTGQDVQVVLQKMEKKIADWYNSIPQETGVVEI
jgi:hypothetical protein